METQFMVKKKTEVPPELLSKEFLKQFKTEEDVSKFLKDLHSQVLEQMLQFNTPHLSTTGLVF